MIDTPRTDEAVEHMMFARDFIALAQGLERELNAALEAHRGMAHYARDLEDKLIKANPANATLLHWCPVGEMLPEAFASVLAVTESGVVIIAWYDSETNCWFDVDTPICGVTHWSPWPEVPPGLKGAV